VLYYYTISIYIYIFVDGLSLSVLATGEKWFWMVLCYTCSAFLPGNAIAQLRDVAQNKRSHKTKWQTCMHGCLVQVPRRLIKIPSATMLHFLQNTLLSWGALWKPVSSTQRRW
jgi:hypothetical protein